MRGRIKVIQDSLYWDDRYGVEHPIQDMDDIYIAACIDFLYRRTKMSKLEAKDILQATIDMEIFKEEQKRREFVKTTKVGRLLYV